MRECGRQGRIVPVDRLERGAPALEIIAAVAGDEPAVSEHDTDLAGHLLGLDETTTLPVCGVVSQSVRDEVHLPLHPLLGVSLM